MEKYEYLTGKTLDYKLGVVEQAKFEYSSLGKVFNKGLKEDEEEERILKRLSNINDDNEKQLQEIKNEHLKLVKRIRDDKRKLKSLIYQIDKEDVGQLDYFDNLVKLELGIDYTKLYCQSGNKDKDAFNFNKCRLMIDFYQRLKNSLITFKKAILKLSRFNGLLDMLKKRLLVKKVINKKILKY